ncbi:MAG: hypothetical protein JWM39_809 [Parcubacteria group bacterium]|nr:hypothetical protein [Parcubacteria group bacterium]
MGNMTDQKSKAREAQALGIFNSLTHGLKDDMIDRIKNGSTTNGDRAFVTVRQAICAWNDFLITSDGEIETPGKPIHMRA